MWLLIDADQNAATGWEGYDFIVNRTVEPDGNTWLEKNTGGWKWTESGEGEQRGSGATNCSWQFRARRLAWRRGQTAAVIRFQMGGQPAASRRHHGLLPQRRRGSRRTIQLSILG